MTSREQNDDISKDELDGIRRGLDDVANGRVRPFKEIQAELENDGRGDVRGIGAETTETDAQRGWPKAAEQSTSNNTSNPVHLGNTTPPLRNERPSERHSVPTPVPLEPREWLKENFTPTEEGVEIIIIDGRFVCLRRNDGSPCKITDALESYSSHVNAALMEKLAQLRIRAFRNSPNKSCDHATDCTIWRDDGNGNAPEFDNSCGPCNCGALERFQQKRAEAAESRISELERERDAARELVTYWHDSWKVSAERAGELAGINEHTTRLLNETAGKVAAVESQLSTTQEALRNLLRHCDVNPEGESVFERDVIYARALLAERVLSPPTKLP